MNQEIEIDTNKPLTKVHVCDKMSDKVNREPDLSPIVYYPPEDEINAMMGGELNGWQFSAGEYFTDINFCPFCGNKL